MRLMKARFGLNCRAIPAKVFPVFFKSGFWRKCRITFRWFRIAVWLLVLLVLGAFLWVNRVGLPDFLKTPLVAALRERGVELEFSRMRLSLVRGLVADDVRAGEAGGPAGASFAARLVELELDFPELWNRRLALNGLVLRDGVFNLPFSPTNALVLTNLQAGLRFGTNDTWSLDELGAEFAGARITINGQMTHVRRALEWKLFTGGSGGDRGEAAASLQEFSDALRQIHFEGTPQLRLNIAGDGRDIHSIALRLDAGADGVKTPWFAAKKFQAAVNLTAPTNIPGTNDASWGFWTNVQPFRLAWSAQLAELHSEKINLGDVNCSGLWAAPELTISNVSARLGGGGAKAALALNVPARQLEFHADAGFDPGAVAKLLPENARTNLARVVWSKAPQLKLDGSLRVPPWTNRAAAYDPALQFDGLLSATNLTVAGFKLDRVRGFFGRQKSLWEVADLAVAQGRTELHLAGQLDESRREYQVRTRGSLDGASLRPFSTNVMARGLAQLTAAQPLKFTLDAAGNLSHQDSLSVTGQVALGRTDLRWRGRWHEAAGDLHLLTEGAFDMNSLRAFLPTNSAHGFGLLTFQEPLKLALDVTGNLRQLETLSITGQVALADFAVRDQRMEHLSAALVYSNWTAEFYRPQASRANGEQTFTADQVTLDLAGERLWFKNGFGRVEIMVIGRAIGPKTAAAMSPYEFLAVPTARVNGCVPIKMIHGDLVLDDADLRVDIEGTTPFRWRRFETPAIGGTVHWWKNLLILTNITSECYAGTATGWGRFNLVTPGAGTDFSFFLQATNVDLHKMGLALWSPTNHLEGSLSGTVLISDANSSDWRTWNGAGKAQLLDGLLWDVPIFALMSPLLNAFSPGLGNSRATEVTGQFIMTNGVISSDSVVIQAQSMRLEYSGTVDLEEKLNARVTARLLRNMPVIGSVLSFVLTPVSKIFECRVGGTLSDPKVSPVYIPKILLAPLHPIRTLEELFSPSATATATNAPPEK